MILNLLLLLMAAVVMLVGVGGSAAQSAADEPRPVPATANVAFVIPTEDPNGPLHGQADLPSGARCEDGGIRYPAVVMVPGTGVFDRDVEFGNSHSPADRIFKVLSERITAEEVIAVRFDYRGIEHGRKFDSEVRRRVTPESTRDDIRRVFAYATRMACVDPDRVAVFAHSEGTVHVARLVGDGQILPNGLVFLGMVSSSPRSIVHWQTVGRTLERVQRAFPGRDRITNAELRGLGFTGPLSPDGSWTLDEVQAELERVYEWRRAEQLAIPDDRMRSDFWAYRFWKMWWSDDRSPADSLRDYPYAIHAHFADHDDSTPGPAEMARMEKAATSFHRRPRLVMHEGRGHTLGTDRLVGPMVEADATQLVGDIVRAARTEPEGDIDWARVPYLGIMFSVSDSLPPGVRQAGIRSNYGLKLDRVLPGLPAWRAGLRVGDVVLALNGQEVGLLPKKDAANKLSRRARALVPGSTATFKILRWKTEAAAFRGRVKVAPPALEGPRAGESIEKFVRESEPGVGNSLTWTRAFEILDVSVEIKLPESARPPAQPIATSESDRRLAELTRKLHRHYGRERELDDLLKRMRDGTIRPDPFRLPLVDALQHDPLAIRTATMQVLERARPVGGVVESVRRLLRLSEEEAAWGPPTALPWTERPGLRTGITPAEHLAQIRQLLHDANSLRDLAFSALTADEHKFLRDNLPALATKFLEWNYVYADPDPERLNRNLQVLDLLAKMDLRPLLRAARALVGLAEPSYVEGLKDDLARAGLDLRKPVVLEEATPHGLIRIAGTGDDDHQDLEAQGVAVLIDLGGNDIYRNQAGTARGKLGVSVIIDLAGDDTYESSTDVSIGAGFMGVGMIADLGGNDRYLGTRMTQGFGMAGVGLLIDFSGNDEYRAQQLAQGAGFFGTGILFDGSGDDRYEARSHAQAVSIGGGSAFLIDRSGNDLYFAKGLQPSGYGTPGTYEGWSQGAGVGLRYLASGGLAILHDGGGKDRMEGGDFSQAVGYYYGWGIVDARGEDPDVYIGNRYAQGAAAHYGVASFLDEGGDDFYDTRGGVAVGPSNDHAITWFHDGGGNDRYPAQLFSGGSSANNAIALFEDVSGRDRWVGATPPTTGQTNEYWGGTSLSLAFFAEPRAGDSPALPPVEARDANTFVVRLGLLAEDLARDPDLDAKLPPFRGMGARSQ
jgi:hypothetical protein